MLILTRHPGQSVEIKDKETGAIITVTVLAHTNQGAKLGFIADQQFLILRTELKDRDKDKDS